MEGQRPSLGDVTSSQVQRLPPSPASPVSQTGNLKVTYRQFEEYLVAEKGQSESCATLPFTFIFWITFSILAWLHGDVHNIYETRRCLSSVVEDVKVVAAAGTQQARNVSLGTFASKDDIWEWLALGFVPALSGSGPDGSAAGFVRTYNKLIGSVRLTQKRSATMDCKVSEALKNSSLLFYGETKCHSGKFSTETFGDTFEVSPGEFSTGDMAYKAGGELANGDKRTFYAWLDPRNPKDAQNRCASLWSNGWLDRASHDLVVEAAFFNAEVKTFALLSISFEFRKGGLIHQAVDLRPLSANLYPAWYHYIPDALWVLWLFLLFQKEMRQLYDSCRQGSAERREYLSDPWNCLDWSSIIIGFGIALFFWFLTSGIEDFKSSVGSLSDLVDPLSSFTQDPAQSSYGDSVAWNERMNKILDSMDILVWMKIYHRIAMFGYTIILMARYFKGFRGQPRIALISKTLALASMDLMHFYYILATVFVNFVLGGYVLFGAQLHEWSSIHNSVQSAFAMTFGKLDYQSLHQIAPVSAAIWFWSYIVIVVFVFFNMCISIILGHYTEVRASFGGAGQSMWMQGKWLFQDCYWHYSYEFRYLHRLAVSKMKPKWRRRLSYFPPEVERHPIPMNAMFRAVTPNADEYIRKSMPTLKFDRKTSGGELAMKEVTMDLLLECGCDTVTAETLLMRAHRYQSIKNDVFNPMDELVKKLDEDMMERYAHLASIEERVFCQTEETIAGLQLLEDTSSKCLEAVKKLQPAEEEPPGKAIAGSVLRELEDASGHAYYYNPQTGESQWEHPLKKPNRLALAMSGAQDAFASAALQVLQKPVRPLETQEEDPQVSSSSAAEAPVEEPARDSEGMSPPPP
eukprot:gnl/MRDRNA2_/MRDRNA2_95161_c0_seq1.p1 gnl/MRDRNA2_/MRDRNA2_95161_c0~~gnl/MRDRNA2_/MRDRNA2_95161_c0_seq1.p1  ORF type:complete len:858 (-),score=132.38 gnl/MRDRNA2_/MRDRNA2_95161_c0_seq1:167-2740(-)